MSAEITRIAYDLLSRREHSVTELTQKLKQREFATDEIAQLIVKLQEANLQSDLRFAESLIRSRANRGYGKRYIDNELKHKGVDSHTAMLAFEENEIDWFEQVAHAYDKKFGQRPIKDDKDKAKRIRFLQYRGFSFEQIMTLLD